MKYKKVFSKARFQTRSRNSFQVNEKRRQILVGARSEGTRSAYLGKVIEQGKVSTLLDYEVYCDVSFPHVIGIFGSRGSGKSFDLGVFVEEIFGQVESVDCTDSAIIFDVQDQFWTLGYDPSEENQNDTLQLKELEKWGIKRNKLSNIKVFAPANIESHVPNTIPFALSPTQLCDADFLAILELERFSPMGQAVLTLLESEGQQIPEKLAKKCSNRGILKTYQQGTIDGLRWRLQSLAKTGIIQESGVDVDRLLTRNTVSIIQMRNLSDAVRSLVVGVISRLVSNRMGRVQQARNVSQRTGKNIDKVGPKFPKKVWTILDEAHVLVPSDKVTPATLPLIDYVKRGRDAGLSLIFATQQPSAVHSKLMSQVDITLTHTLGFESDLSSAVNRMPTRSAVEYEVESEKASSISDVIRSLSPGEAILADGSSSRIFIVKIRPRKSAHGGNSPN